jgi:hypothetical protein
MRSKPPRAASIAPLMVLLSLIGFSACPHAVLGAPAAGKAPTSRPAPPPQIVTIKKVDGSTLRGKVVGGDGVQLTVAPIEGKAFGQPVELAWQDVKTVSNGLTQRKQEDAWKLTHKDELCEVCHGERAIACATCKGTGHDPESSKDCKTCNGAQQVKCNQPKCDKGKVPCPGPCLKLSEGHWTTTKDGKHVRTFKMQGETVTVGEEHIGQTGKFEGKTIQFADCPTCGKTGTINCPTCHGTSFMPCPTCKADKKPADCASCEDGYIACASCAGTGLKGAAAAAVAKASTGQPAPQAPAAEVKAGSPAEPKPEAKKSSNDGLD